MTRAELLMSVIEPRYEGRWSDTTCADLACHEGYYSLILAQKGCKKITGIDARQKHLDDAALIRSAYGLSNWDFAKHDLQEVNPEVLGTFDIIVLFGLLYHVENPVKVLRLVHAITKDVCLIETQIAPHISGPTDWGSYLFNKEIKGCFALVDEKMESVIDAPEASISSISLFPSLEGLKWMLKTIGFSRVELIKPEEHHYEQLRFGKRSVVAAYK